MLASITPLGERGRRSSWAVTVTAFALAASAAGVALGAALGALGGLLLGGLGDPARLAALAAVAALTLALELARRLPGPRRQVNEDWLGAWRGWVYGAGFGAQIGAGVLTVVNSAAVYAALAAALLSGTPARGALILGAGALVRGAIPLLGAGVRRPEQLARFHRRFLALATPAHAAALAGQGIVVVVALAI